MKKAFIILILIISSELSTQFQELPPKAVRALKCIFGTNENIESLIKFLKTVFTEKQSYMWIFSGMGVADVLQKCLNIDIMKLLEKYLFKAEEQKVSLLMNLQKADGPVLLRKYLYDLVAKNDVLKAKRDCHEMTKMSPYDKHQNICNIFGN